MAEIGASLNINSNG